MKCSTSWSISNTHVHNHGISSFFSTEYFQTNSHALMWLTPEASKPKKSMGFDWVQGKAELSPKALTGKNYVRLPNLTEAYFSWLAPLPLWMWIVFFGWQKSENLRSFFVPLKPQKFGESHINRHMRAFGKTADNSSNFLLHWKNKLRLFS